MGVVFTEGENITDFHGADGPVRSQAREQAMGRFTGRASSTVKKVLRVFLFFRSILTDMLMILIRILFSIQYCINVYIVYRIKVYNNISECRNFIRFRCKVSKLLLLKIMFKELTLSMFCIVLSLFNFEPTR